MFYFTALPRKYKHISANCCQMETDIDSNFSSTEFFNFSNSTVKPNLHFVIDEKSKWTNAEIARLIHIIIRPILIVFGTIGNCLSFYIMRRTSLKDVSSCFYMSLLAVADTGRFYSFHLFFINIKSFWHLRLFIITAFYF